MKKIVQCEILEDNKLQLRPFMITIEEGKNLLKRNVIPLDTIEIAISDALQYITESDINAPFDNPFFDMTAVDGYAVRFKDIANISNQSYNLRVIGELKAGDNPGNFAVSQGECLRIFTGAGIPQGADTVVMQEHVIQNGNNIEIEPHGIKSHGNVRFK
jgi:molybdopterin molybdotransferase